MEIETDKNHVHFLPFNLGNSINPFITLAVLKIKKSHYGTKH